MTPEEDGQNAVDTSNANEEEVEIRPEDTSGKPTEDPDYPKKDGTEDPHRVKQWRTWLDSQMGPSTSQPAVTGLPTKGKLSSSASLSMLISYQLYLSG